MKRESLAKEKLPMNDAAFFLVKKKIEHVKTSTFSFVKNLRIKSNYDRRIPNQDVDSSEHLFC